MGTTLSAGNKLEKQKMFRYAKFTLNFVHLQCVPPIITPSTSFPINKIMQVLINYHDSMSQNICSMFTLLCNAIEQQKQSDLAESRSLHPF
jgi:hypothetical protein